MIIRHRDQQRGRQWPRWRTPPFPFVGMVAEGRTIRTWSRRGGIRVPASAVGRCPGMQQDAADGSSLRVRAASDGQPQRTLARSACEVRSAEYWRRLSFGRVGNCIGSEICRIVPSLGTLVGLTKRVHHAYGLSPVRPVPSWRLVDRTQAFRPPDGTSRNRQRARNPRAAG